MGYLVKEADLVYCPCNRNLHHLLRTLRETSFLSLETCPGIHLIIHDIMLKRNLADPERVQVSNWEVPRMVDLARLSGMGVFFRKYVCILAGSLTLLKVLRGQSNELSVLLALTV